MNIDSVHFTPGMSLLGGLIIGLASALFLLANGRIAGISGMVWRVAFLLGLVLAPAVLSPFTAPLTPTIEAGPTTLIIAGLLVGIGTRYGGGCTSGHGVCGLSRLSPRSLIATLAFMGSGVAIVFAMRHLMVHP